MLEQVVPAIESGWTQPLIGSHALSVHWLPSSQITAPPAEQVPAWQLSLDVHASPSSQVVPSVTAIASQFPVVALHCPALHWSSNAEQSTAEPWQAPD
jgi:hypothetical protein